MSVLGLIPARAGSKRLPGKNKRKLGGIPLVVRAIFSAQNAKILNKVVVSTDDTDIMALAAASGVDVLKRPPEYATDEASSYDVILHALEYYPSDWVCFVQCTSPFTLPKDIDGTIEIADPAAVSVSYGSKVPNGAVYVARTSWLRLALKATEAPFDAKKDIKHYEMDASRSLDIDTQEDWNKAEDLMKEIERGL